MLVAMLCANPCKSTVLYTCYDDDDDDGLLFLIEDNG